MTRRGRLRRRRPRRAGRGCAIRYRESGTAGIFRPTGEVREGLIDEIVHGIDPASILFDAPRKDQQVWFVRRFGAEVNLGNVPTGEVLALETLRLGLRSDTMGVGRRGGG